MATYENSPGSCIAAAQSGAAASGGFLTSHRPYNVTSIGAPSSSVYLVTLPDGIDQLQSIALVSVGTVARAATVVWTGDTTYNVTGSDLATPSAGDTIFQFAVIRTNLGL